MGGGKRLFRDRSGLFGNMWPHCAGWKFLELIPIINDLVAASPALLQVMEDGGSRVVSADAGRVFIRQVVFVASLVNAPMFPVLHHYLLGFLVLLRLNLLLLQL